MNACIEQSFLCSMFDKKSRILFPASMKRIRGSNGMDVTTMESHAVVSKQERRDLQ